MMKKVIQKIKWKQISKHNCQVKSTQKNKFVDAFKHIKLKYAHKKYIYIYKIKQNNIFQ